MAWNGRLLNLCHPNLQFKKIIDISFIMLRVFITFFGDIILVGTPDFLILLVSPIIYYRYYITESLKLFYAR